jgi:hypothetical protein
MTARRAIDFIRYHGVVLESVKGLEPSLAIRIAVGPIRGGSWDHPMSREIFALTRKIHSSNAVLICSLARGKITYIHRRLWPAFVRLATKFPHHALDKVREVHLPSGRHQRQDIPFPDWVPEGVSNLQTGCLLATRPPRFRSG